MKLDGKTNWWLGELLLLPATLNNTVKHLGPDNPVTAPTFCMNGIRSWDYNHPEVWILQWAVIFAYLHPVNIPGNGRFIVCTLHFSKNLPLSLRSKLNNSAGDIVIWLAMEHHLIYHVTFNDIQAINGQGPSNSSINLGIRDFMRRTLPKLEVWVSRTISSGHSRDNIAKEVQSHFIRGACLKQPNFNSKTYANKYKQHIYDGNACPEHRDVNWMV